jgi:heat shock protein HslJ/photosystem II stability/assembly factor-like uncharacterized protein
MRLTTALILILVLAAAGCTAGAPGAPGEPPAAQEPATAESPTAAPAETSEPPVEATATPEPTAGAAGADPLAGTSWLLASFGPVGAEQEVAAGSRVTLLFQAGGNAGGNAGCNSYGGAYEVDGETISFAEIASTLMACEDGIIELEGSYLAALQSAVSFRLEDGRLVISYDGGRSSLIFVREGEATAPPAGEESAGAPVELHELYMVDARRGWARGRLAENLVEQILLTTDGGESWQLRTPPDAPRPGPEVQQELAAAATFASAEMGWVSYWVPAPLAPDASPRVWVTSDGGASWEASEPLVLSDLPFDFFGPSDLGFLDETFGWLLAHLGAGMSHDYVAIFTTGDGGATWQRVTDPEQSPEIQGCNKSALVFHSEDEGWLAGDCPGLMPQLTLYQTADGGATWNPTVLPLVDGQPPASAEELGNACGVRQMVRVAPGTLLLSLHCFDWEADSRTAWLYRSDDGGESWQAEPLPVSDGFFAFATPDAGWILGEAAGELGVLWATEDGAATWERQARVAGQGQVAFVDERHGWILTGGGMETPVLLRLERHGSWQPLDPALRR